MCFFIWSDQAPVKFSRVCLESGLYKKKHFQVKSDLGHFGSVHSFGPEKTSSWGTAPIVFVVVLIIFLNFLVVHGMLRLNLLVSPSAPLQLKIFYVLKMPLYYQLLNSTLFLSTPEC